jgi:hypothetical protein
LRVAYKPKYIFAAAARRDALLSSGIDRAMKKWLKAICGITKSKIQHNTEKFILNKIIADTVMLMIAHIA